MSTVSCVSPSQAKVIGSSPSGSSRKGALRGVTVAVGMIAGVRVPVGVGVGVLLGVCVRADVPVAASVGVLVDDSPGSNGRLNVHHLT